MSFPIHQIDAFTGEPFSGNPAAVCPLGRALPADWMQVELKEDRVARPGRAVTVWRGRLSPESAP